MEKIDFVVPYVNNQDKVWQKTFVDYAMRHDYRQVASMHGYRYEDIGLIDYQLKLVEKNMPWVNTIYLLLSNKGQEPKYIPKNCKIVYHNEFIPQKYLPTFNSTTIEMFLWNIQGLSEHFIYANDDMLPLKPLKPSDFFENDKIKINFKENYHLVNNALYQYQCYNSYAHILDKLGIIHNNKYYYPFHSFTPMIKSHCVECFELLKDKILPNIRAFRTEEQHNQYIYPNYELAKYGVISSTIEFNYSQLTEPHDIFQEIVKKSQILCPNVLKDKKNTAFLVQFLGELCE